MFAPGVKSLWSGSSCHFATDAASGWIGAAIDTQKSFILDRDPRPTRREIAIPPRLLSKIEPLSFYNRKQAKAEYCGFPVRFTPCVTSDIHGPE